MARTFGTRSLGALIVVVALLCLGCATRMLWHQRDNRVATRETFLADHGECIKSVGIPVKNMPDGLIVPEREFRYCMMAKGWVREKRDINYGVPAGWYRGLEDEGPVPSNYVPQQIQPPDYSGRTGPRR
jgi:hypothetical protein